MASRESLQNHHSYHFCHFARRPPANGQESVLCAKVTRTTRRGIRETLRDHARLDTALRALLLPQSVLSLYMGVLTWRLSNLIRSWSRGEQDDRAIPPEERRQLWPALPANPGYPGLPEPPEPRALFLYSDTPPAGSGKDDQNDHFWTTFAHFCSIRLACFRGVF